MPGPFPCNNPPSQCETNPNPLTSFSSEAEDSTTFVSLAWAAQLPALNKPFTVYPCEGIAESQVSQADSDIKATNLAVACANPCAPVFFNTAQTATGTCPNGIAYSLTIPAGIFTADNQVLADRKAFTAAVAALRGHSICLGSLAPASVCRGEFYFGIIGVTTSDAPATIVLLSGELPDGLVLTSESDRAVIQGTPTSFGVGTFVLQATSAIGVMTQQQYSVAVIGIVTDSPLTPGTVGTVYFAQLTAVMADGAIENWMVTAGQLPDGLSLDAGSGAISGTPTTAGDSAFTVSVSGGISSCPKDFTVSVQSNSDICTDGIGGIATNRYGIDGYFDGMIPNPSSPSFKPAWDGTFLFYMDGDSGGPNPGIFGWATGGPGDSGISISGNKACNVQLLFNGCIASVPQWELLITDIDSNPIWDGNKVGGQTPEGVFNLTGGVDVSPLTLTIVLVDQSAVPMDHNLSCTS